jgi:hypothetical protein
VCVQKKYLIKTKLLLREDKIAHVLVHGKHDFTTRNGVLPGKPEARIFAKQSATNHSAV